MELQLQTVEEKKKKPKLCTNGNSKVKTKRQNNNWKRCLKPQAGEERRSEREEKLIELEGTRKQNLSCLRTKLCCISCFRFKWDFLRAPLPPVVYVEEAYRVTLIAIHQLNCTSFQFSLPRFMFLECLRKRSDKLRCAQLMKQNCFHAISGFSNKRAENSCSDFLCAIVRQTTERRQHDKSNRQK